MPPYNEIPCTMGVCVRKEEREQELLFTELSFKLFIYTTVLLYNPPK